MDPSAYRQVHTLRLPLTQHSWGFYGQPYPSPPGGPAGALPIFRFPCFTYPAHGLILRTRQCRVADVCADTARP